MSFLEELHKPDILDCISHLSSDEVFTPPKLVNEILDTLPQELFTSPDTKFLDPCCKSGVFLREIAKRLIKEAMSYCDNCSTLALDTSKNIFESCGFKVVKETKCKFGNVYYMKR